MDNPTEVVADTEHGLEERARFTAMENGTQEDWSIIARDYFKFAETLPDPGSKDTYSRARSLFDSGPAAALYFASAERSLGQVMLLLGSGDLADLDKAEALWQQTLLAAAQAAWQAVREGLGRSPRALRADAKLYPRLLALLRPLRPPENNFPIADKEAQA